MPIFNEIFIRYDILNLLLLIMITLINLRVIYLSKELNDAKEYIKDLEKMIVTGKVPKSLRRGK